MDKFEKYMLTWAFDIHTKNEDGSTKFRLAMQWWFIWLFSAIFLGLALAILL